MTDNSNIISGMLTDADAAELEAFKADVEMAKYMARVEKGELIEEELENRNAMLNFINRPCDLPDELFEKKKGDVCMEREIELINEIRSTAPRTPSGRASLTNMSPRSLKAGRLTSPPRASVMTG